MEDGGGGGGEGDGEAPPENVPPAAEGRADVAEVYFASETQDEQADDIEQTAAKIAEILPRQMSSVRRMSMGGERVEVDRTALEAILDVSSRLKDIQKKSRLSMSTLALAHESYKDKQVNKLNN